MQRRVLCCQQQVEVSRARTKPAAGGTQHAQSVSRREATEKNEYDGVQVSGWFVMTTADVRRIAEPWLRFSEDVRLDPEVTACTLVDGVAFV